eukprot:4626242-Pleurochrysis_carterae.AAC.1
MAATHLTNLTRALQLSQVAMAKHPLFAGAASRPVATAVVRHFLLPSATRIRRQRLLQCLCLRLRLRLELRRYRQLLQRGRIG